MASDQIRPEFVEAMPEELTEGLLYISIRFRTAAHMCACGCGARIVTPVRPAKWAFTYDGESISVWPSVGNWQKACRSHYVIKKNEIIWAREWTEDEIAEGRARDQALLRSHCSQGASQPASVDSTDGPADARCDSWVRQQLRKLRSMVRRS